ncbi:MFS transporter [Mesorhizobium sp. M1E.F.Ca.ET.063.01.1.1]|nr:MFS transporter [Mesorhizobium sp. M1E.F.Ca.ET.063.01.1.1]
MARTRRLRSALVMMIRVESRAPAPFIPRELFKDRRFSIATAVGFLLSIGIYGQMFVLSIFFQEGAGYSATATGLALLPFAVTTIIGPLLAGRAIAAYGAHRVLLFGQAAGSRAR